MPQKYFPEFWGHVTRALAPVSYAYGTNYISCAISNVLYMEIRQRFAS